MMVRTLHVLAFYAPIVFKPYFLIKPYDETLACDEQNSSLEAQAL